MTQNQLRKESIALNIVIGTDRILKLTFPTGGNGYKATCCCRKFHCISPLYVSPFYWTYGLIAKLFISAIGKIVPAADVDSFGNLGDINIWFIIFKLNSSKE
jgi:hypothetical protein